ncbi:MAG: flagellar hook-associated protein FlgK [Anaerolineaceae bacterium]|nr:flagellar hook-associated protein FlgK [Anaerolineaceae bacterium]
MPTISSGINISLEGVLANTQAMEIVDHNVSNANTAGYHRQSAVLTANAPTAVEGPDRGLGAGQQGNGVTVSNIQRFSLGFYDDRYRSASAQSSNLDAQSSGLTQLESTLNETSDSGLIPQMDQFFTDWQDIASDPSNTSLRSQLLSTASALSSAFNTRSTSLTQMQNDQDAAIVQNVATINSVAGQIASLNGQIAQGLAEGTQPNDLMDKRDTLLDQLAQVSGAVSSVQKNGEATVFIGGHALVTDTSTFSLQTSADPLNSNLSKISWQDGQAFTAPNGTLAGELQIRDVDIPNQLKGLDTLANSFATQVNTLHETGYGLNNAHGLDVFTGTTAATISLNTNLDVNSIGASDTIDEPGNNNIANQIANLKSSKVLNGNTQTLDDFYNAQVTDLATKTQNAGNNATQSAGVTQSMDDQRQSVSGVSLDEEAANLSKYQTAYQACARVMTAMNTMLDTIINSMGVTG